MSQKCPAHGLRGKADACIPLAGFITVGEEQRNRREAHLDDRASDHLGLAFWRGGQVNAQARGPVRREHGVIRGCVMQHRNLERVTIRYEPASHGQVGGHVLIHCELPTMTDANYSTAARNCRSTVRLAVARSVISLPGSTLSTLVSPS